MRSVLVLTAAMIGALSVASECHAQACSIWRRAEDSTLGNAGKPRGPAALFSPSVALPSFRIRFVDGSKADAAPVQVEDVVVSYAWRWLEYPYPEHPWGAWSLAADAFHCPVGSELIVHGYRVTPRGWYAGIYTRFPWPKRPSFQFISIGGHTLAPDCMFYVEVPADRTVGLAGRNIVISVNCHGKSTFDVR